VELNFQSMRKGRILAKMNESGKEKYGIKE
jgi:hypothetical protein